MKPLSFLSFLCVISLATANPDPSLLLSLPLDEGTGALITDATPNALEGELNNVRWARGGFGAAAHFDGTNSFIDLPEVPGLNGATQCTISLWALWEGTGRYPNLLTSRNWSPGGLMFFVNNETCSFRMGKPGQRSSDPEGSWSETGVTVLKDVPLRRWTHLCAVFSLPDITTYVDGKPVAKGSWKYPVEAHGLRIGAWAGPVSHRGLIDDVRIYGRALSAPEIAALATAPNRTDATYTVLDESKAPRPIAAALENRHARLTIDDLGRVASLRLKHSDRELLLRPQPLVTARLKDDRQITARRATFDGGVLRFAFAGNQGAASIAVGTHDDFFTFKVASLTLTNAASLTFVNLPVTASTHQGAMANMLSDDADAVCLRGLDLPVEMSAGGHPPALRAWTTDAHGLTGGRAALAAGEKRSMPPLLRAMAEHAGVPVSKLGGPWSLGAEANRGSYLFADLTHESTDDWIELAQRGGFTHIHLHGWWQTLGHYAVRTNHFPRGIADMKDTVARIHAAGLKAGIHTLTACIDTRDAWVTPEPSPHLIPWDTYTLASPITETNTVLYVNERASDRHDVVFTYSGNGNAIRIGSEIIQYGEIVREPPYAFAKCQRGAFKTKASAHAAGERADYLQQRYLAFYPQPDSSLAASLADRIADVFNTCGLDQIYFDGSEGMMSRYGIDAMRHAIFRRLRGEVLAEASAHGAHNWWFHSRLGAWDHPVWAAKRFQDRHIETSSKYRLTDLLEPQMGWWAPRTASAIARGHFLDEMEYFAAKNLGLDAAMSIQGVNVSRNPLPLHIENQITLLGWYERLRLARYFDAGTVARVAGPGDEFRLRQNRDGAWQFTPVTMNAHRVTAVGDGSESWGVINEFEAQPLAARIEALYSVVPYDHPKRVCLADYEDMAGLKQATASGAISLRLSQETQDAKGGAKNLRLLAQNKGLESRGAWARASLDFPAPYRSITGTGAIGVWIKGDGKGALLNIQVACPREFHHALSDHYVALDFTGWRYFELLFRERDVDQMTDYVWPYDRGYSLYRNSLDLAHISGVSFYLNGLPAGGSTDVTVGPIMALPTQPAELKNAALSLNGQTLALPTPLKSGEFVDVEPDGMIFHHGEKGDLTSRRQMDMAHGWPKLATGRNAASFDCEKPQDRSARAEITINAFGSPFGSRNAAAEIGSHHLSRECEMTRLILPSDGNRDSWNVAVRPGAQARLEIEFRGPMDSPVLTVRDRRLRFPMALKAGERLLCTQGRHWMALDAKRKRIAEGDLEEEPPILKEGQNKIAFECASTDRGQVRLVKVYE